MLNNYMYISKAKCTDSLNCDKTIAIYRWVKHC